MQRIISYHLNIYRRARRNQDGGFTIVELLIVIVVIAILAAIGTIAFQNVVRNARNSARVQAAGNLVQVLRAYQATNGTSQLAGLLSNACVGTSYTDVDPGPGYSCRYVQYTDGSTQTYPVNTALDDELRTTANVRFGAGPVVQRNFSNISSVTMSAPIVNYSATHRFVLDATGQDLGVFALISYRLDGDDQDCKLPEVYRQISQSGNDHRIVLNQRNSVTNGGATECWARLDFLD